MDAGADTTGRETVLWAKSEIHLKPTARAVPSIS
jgi:hypothetical protein